VARLIPKIALEDITLKPERDVARALTDQLAQDCVVYHSYPWLRAERNDRGKDTLREGETDFVIVLPELGFLVLEVKGGSIEYDAGSHLWYRLLPHGGRKEIRDPLEQARKNTHILEEKIAKSSFCGKKHVPCAFGYAIVFPDCSYSGPVPSGAEYSILLSANDLPHLSKRIPEILKKWNQSERAHSFTREELDGVLKALSPAFQLLPVLYRRIEEQEERLFRLTEEQLNILNILQNHQKAALEGVAGSGKTMLAMAQAQRFADSGANTLFVCFNKALAEWLEAGLPEGYQSRIKIANFHRLCHEYCTDTGIPFAVPSVDAREFWRTKAAELFIDAIAKSDKRFDAIVVDEGQDFFSDWWIPLELILRPEGAFYLFYDPSQNLFVGNEFTIPGLGKPFRLPTNCRNTRRIAATCSYVRGVDIPVRKDAPEGDETIVSVANSPCEQVRICQQKVSEWLGKGGLKPSQIAILGPHTRTNSSLKETTSVRSVPITGSLDAWKNNMGILYSTIRGFKGLETDVAIIIDVPPPGSLQNFTPADFYVACSRAKHLLVVLPICEGIV
jgi:hypothetical protein